MVRGRPVPLAHDAHWAKRILWRTAVRRAYRDATTVIAVSADLGHVTEGLTGRPIDRVVHNGVDLASFRALRRDTRPEPTLGYVGRLTAEKAPEVAIAAARLADARIDVFGDGPLLARLQGETRDPAVRFRGWTTPQQAFAGIDILVVPSFREGLGNVILEAGAAGIPVVARAAGGIPEIFAHDQALSQACLVPASAEPADFAQAIRPLLDSREHRIWAGQRLAQVIASRFSVDAAAAELADVIRDAAAR